MPGMKPTKQENASDNIVEEIKKAPALPPVVTLKLLIEEGMLTPGTDVLSLEYKGFITSGSLIPDGRIEYDGRCYLGLLDAGIAKAQNAHEITRAPLTGTQSLDLTFSLLDDVITRSLVTAPEFWLLPCRQSVRVTQCLLRLPQTPDQPRP